MSVPAFAWAIEKGMELRLTPTQRLLLLYMADQARGCSDHFYTGQPRLAHGTGLTTRTIRVVTQQLVELGLISADPKPGIGTVYRLLRQPLGQEAASAPAMASSAEARSAPANGAGLTPEADSAPEGRHPGNPRQPPRKLTAVTPEAASANPSLPKKETLKARAPTREGQEGRKEFLEEKEVSQASQPTPPPAVPPPDTTADWFNDPRPETALPPARGGTVVADRPAVRSTPKAEAPTAPARTDREPTVEEINANRDRQLRELGAVAPLAEGLARAWFSNYPPRAPRLTREEMLSVAAPPRRRQMAALTPEQLAAVRQRAGYALADPP